MKRKKIKLNFVFLFFILSESFAQNEFMHSGFYFDLAGGSLSQFRFRAPNSVEYRNWSGDISKTGIYHINHEYGIPFLTLYWNDGTSQRYLMLLGEYLMALYIDNTMPVFLLNWFHCDADRIFLGPNITNMQSITATSSLRWGNIHFAATAERLGPHINQVWAVEGGVGERLFITQPSQSVYRLFISIGYVHFSRPYLFHHNARPKRMRVMDAYNQTLFFNIELRDTPNFQLINLATEGIWSHNIIIEILEIFPGTRYNHMCINSILGMWSQ